MKRSPLLLLPPLLFLLSACARAPSGGGGPPEGDFPVQVVAAPVKAMNLRDTVRLVGTLMAAEEIHVTARIQAEVLELPVKAGDRVAENDVLLRLDDSRLQARLAEVEARVLLARNTFERTDRLFASSTATRQELDEARAALDQALASRTILSEELRDTRVTAPFPGRLGERQLSVGQVVQPGQILFTLTRMDPLELRVEIPERYAAALREGMPVEMRSEAYPGESFAGRVVFLSPVANPETRSIAARAEIANDNEKLRPGMFGQVDVVLAERAGSLVVPEAAVMQRGAHSMVLRKNTEGRAEFVPVETGIRFDGMTEIRSGLREGDIVVVEGLMKARPNALLVLSPDSERYGLSPEPQKAKDGDQ